MMRRGVGRRGRPGVVGTVARTAVIAGTATAVSNKVSQGQANKAMQAQAEQDAHDQQIADQAVAQHVAAEQYYAPPPPPVAPAAPAGGLTDDAISQLKQLAELRDAGILTDEEFAAKKASILGL